MKVEISQVQIKLPHQKGARSIGVHVSAIIRAIAAETGVLKAQWVTESDLDLIELKPSTRFDDPIMALRVAMGLAWEEWYIKNILGPQGILDHPGEIELDGIFMSPDAEELTVIITVKGPNDTVKVHEIKCTYKSVNTVGRTEAEVKNQWMWMAQIKAYCKGESTTLAALHVLFVCGDYSYPIQPDMYRYDIEFEQDEIDDNWILLRTYRDHKLKESEDE